MAAFQTACLAFGIAFVFLACEDEKSRLVEPPSVDAPWVVKSQNTCEVDLTGIYGDSIPQTWPMALGTPVQSPPGLTVTEIRGPQNSTVGNPLEGWYVIKGTYDVTEGHRHGQIGVLLTNSIHSNGFYLGKIHLVTAANETGCFEVRGSLTDFRDLAESRLAVRLYTETCDGSGMCIPHTHARTYLNP
jgi:hypothetical protein